VNWLMMVATVGITIAFGTSDRLAGAYGTAVATTMLLTTALLVIAMRHVWRWPLAAVIGVGGVFFAVDGLFFIANLAKIADGGWLPLTFALVLFIVMITWRSGFDAIRASLTKMPYSEQEFIATLASGAIPRVPGTMVFLTRSIQRVPRLVMDYVHFAGALPERVIALHVEFDELPRATGIVCGVVDELGFGFTHVVCHFGFVEIPDLRHALANAKGLNPPVDVDAAMFIGSRDLVVARPDSSPRRRWQLSLFAFLFRNGAKVVDRFNLPSHNVIEIARQIEI
jgi:KUP system potassium uptake protein